MKVDLGKVRSLSAVITQGYVYESWVSRYYMNYSIDGQVWETIRKPNGEKVSNDC